VLNNFQWLQPAEVDEAFQTALTLRVDLATVEERFRELGARLTEVRAGLEVLRSVARSLDDLGGEDEVEATAAEGASRFRSASRQVFQIIEEERMRIARDMHDGPAQSMANLVLQAEVLERLLLRDPAAVVAELIDFKSVVREALDETRRLIFDLRPMTLDDLGLVPTLRRFVKEYGDKSGIVARFHLVGEERRLPGNYEAVLFRIVQEALANARKHAGARAVDVTLTLQPHRAVAVVKDDGEGFDVAATEARQGRTRNLGLISMRERADLEKGSLEIRSELGKGTEVRATFDF
jgi:two-component system sensor histidine kinase DegS